MSAELAVLEVRLHGTTVGTLTRLPDDRNVFTFDPAYVDDAGRATLSLSFKDAFGALITDWAPTQTRLPPFFANLLPEGSLRDYLARRAGVKSEREFFLAWVLGQDLPGAVEIVPDDKDALPAESQSSAADVAENNDANHTLLRFSLAGVQLKFSAVRKATGGLTIPANGVGGAWIVKLPSSKFAGVPENEFAMMELARRVGIDVPATRLVPVRDIQGLPHGLELLGDQAFVIERFDRAGNGTRVHIEDFAQVFGVYPERKYERASYRNIARVLWIETGEVGIVEFIRRVIFNALIGNADMHLKNWSLVHPLGGTTQLAPAYDFVATIGFLPDDKMALKLVDSKRFAGVALAQFERLADKAGLPQKLTLDAVHETVTAFRKAWEGFELDSLNDHTRRTIDAHLKTIPLWREI